MNERVIVNPNFKSNGEFHRSLAARGVGTKDFPNTHTEVEHLGGGKFAASLSTGHRVFFDKADGDKPKKHKLIDERPGKDYVLVQGAKCCVEVYPYYAKYFDVQHEEVRLYEERWVVQRWREPLGQWQDIGAWNPVITVEEYSEPAGDVMKVTVTYDTDYGILTVEYFQRDGNNLKHNVTFKNTSGGAETFRVLQRWAGIAGDKVKTHGNEYPITDKVSIKDTSFIFGDDLHPYRIYENCTGIKQEDAKDAMELLTGSRQLVSEEVLVDSNGLKLFIRDSIAHLLFDGKEVMSSSPEEFSRMIRAVDNCPENARVYIGGLGLGIILLALARFRKPTEVIVCEKDSRVIDAVSPLVLGYFSKHYPQLNLQIIEGDAATEVPQHGSFDWIFEDFLTEQQGGEYTLEELRTMFAPYLTEGGVHTSFHDPELSGSTRALYLETVEVDVHSQGMKADFTYGNWTLAQNESLEIDPDTATLDDPTEDGHVTDEYVRYPFEIVIRMGVERGGPANRGYVEWDVSSIPNGSTITNTVFKYEGSIHNIDCHVHEMVGVQPSAEADDAEGNQAIFDEAGEGTVYYDVAGFPVVDINQSADLGATADSDLESQLVAGWFAIGIQGDTEVGSYTWICSEEDTSTPDPTLYVEYTPGGWTGKISGVTNPAKVMGVDVANIAKVKGVASA